MIWIPGRNSSFRFSVKKVWLFGQALNAPYDKIQKLSIFNMSPIDNDLHFSPSNDPDPARVVDILNLKAAELISESRYSRDNLAPYSFLLANIYAAYQHFSCKPKTQFQLERIACKLSIFVGYSGFAKDIANRIILRNADSPLWIYSCAHRSGHGSYIEFRDFTFIPIPKNASSTVCAAWVKEKFQEETINPHAYFNNPYFSTMKISQATANKPIVAIIRDPYQRLASYFNGNILKRKSLKEWTGNQDSYMGLSTVPSWKEFIQDFPRYNYTFPDVHHHCLEQFRYLNAFSLSSNPKVRMIPFEHLSSMHKIFPALHPVVQARRLMGGKPSRVQRQLDHLNSGRLVGSEYILKRYARDVKLHEDALRKACFVGAENTGT